MRYIIKAQIKLDLEGTLNLEITLGPITGGHMVEPKITHFSTEENGTPILDHVYLIVSKVIQEVTPPMFKISLVMPKTTKSSLILLTLHMVFRVVHMKWHFLHHI